MLGSNRQWDGLEDPDSSSPDQASQEDAPKVSIPKYPDVLSECPQRVELPLTLYASAVMRIGELQERPR